MPEFCLANVKASLLCCSKIEHLLANKLFDFIGAFVSLRPFQESFKIALFSSSNSNTEIFITISILSIAIKRKSEEAPRYKMTIKIDCVLNVVSYSRLLRNLFKSKYNEVTSSRKKGAKKNF